jgi:hypothetical protein
MVATGRNRKSFDVADSKGAIVRVYPTPGVLAKEAVSY